MMDYSKLSEAFAKALVENVVISTERYAELLKAEHDAQRLKDFIAQKAAVLYDSISSTEIETIAKLFGVFPEKPDESEDIENG